MANKPSPGPGAFERGEADAADALDLTARLLHRDGLLLVIDKPAGLAVHRGPGAGPHERSLEHYLPQLAFGLPRPPALAHRLDRDTSGCLVLGRHRKALVALGKLFARGEVEKTYWAVVEGGPATEEGTIALPLARRDASRGWWMKVDPAGQPSLTRFRVQGRGRDPEHGTPLSWLALEPVTGRTHQLRVHCAAMGWPILGDAIYGDAPRGGGPRLHLHARRVVIPLPRAGRPVTAEAPLPEAMRARIAACGG